MIIFNQEEYENSFKKEDNEILQISSNKSLKEFAEILKNALISGDFSTLSSEDYQLNLFRKGMVRQIMLDSTDEQAENPSIYTHTFNAESENGLDTITSTRSTLFENFERFTYNQNHDFTKVPKEEFDYRLIYEDILDSLGVMPTLYNHTELPVKDLVRLSYMGKNLYFPWQPLTRSNRMPTYEDLKLFDSLSAYEKAAVLDTKHNGTHMIDMLRYLKSKQGMENIVISDYVAEYLARLSGNEAEYKRSIDNLANEMTKVSIAPDYYTMIEDKFKAEFRRAPRVLPEMCTAYFVAYRNMTPAEIADKMVKDFNLNNIKQIAGFHSKILYLLSSDLNFSEIKKDHLSIFAVNFKEGDYNKMVSSGFLKWYQANKNTVKTSDLLNIVRNINSLYFDETLSADELLKRASQARGIVNAALVYEQYGIDFRDSVVAIPGRGLVVTDKVNKVRQYILDKDDARVFTVGQDAHCCQNLAIYGDQSYGKYHDGELSRELLGKHFANIDEAYTYVHEHISELRRRFPTLITPGPGGSCVANELTNPYVWVTIWEDSVTGETIAQADTHYDVKTNTLIYDNIEYVDDGNISRIYDCIATYAENSSFSSIHIGTGYNQHMQAVGKRISTKEYVNYRDDIMPEFSEHYGGHVYSDYSTSAVKVKQNDALFLYSKKGGSSFTIERKPEHDEDIAYLFSPIAAIFYEKSVRERRDIVSRYERQELTVPELNAIAKKNPLLLKDFETLPYETQRIMLYPTDENRMDIKIFEYIKHPDSLLMAAAIEQTPEAIRYFTDVDYDTWKTTLGMDGSLISECPKEYLDEELLLTAINNNPYAIKYVEKDIEEPLRGKLINLAVFKKPILVAHFPDIPEYVWVKICENRGQFVKYNPAPSYKVQKAAVEQSPYNIDEIRDPDKRIVKYVAEKLPYIRSNPRYAHFFRLESEYEDTHANTRVYNNTMPEVNSFNPNTFSYGGETVNNETYGEFDFEDLV